ncbi:MAG TPA: hypothetical protein VM513_16235 [Kofleriaceae bacterium]|jgi:hypothetical protein|nr:hypothetical protein [Kofleriaceae bacterium]
MLDRIIDRTGATHATLTWDGDTLVELAAGGVTIEGAVFDDPLLGRAHALRVGDAVVTTMSALDWARPTQIPAIAAPGALPRGAGAALLNVIATLAHRAGVPALRYAGPYPTPALFRSLARSFTTTATEQEFTADLLGRAARLARDPLPFDFVPAPHERVAFAGGHVELRDGLERAVIDGASYEREGSPASLVERADGIHAQLWFGDAPWAEIARFAPDGRVIDGPHALPTFVSEVLGKEFPLPLRLAIAELVAEAVPAPLAADARTLLAAETIRWADLGARAGAHDATGFAVHAALWERIAPLGLGRLALAIAEALAPVVVSVIVLAATTGARDPSA